jgi:signal peptidase II
MARRYVIFSIAAVITLIADQITKVMARAELALGHPKPVIAGYWEWELSYNTGSAFGLFNSTSGARIFLSLIGVVACIAIVVILKKSEDHRGWNAAALGLVFGGALGNVIDRLIFGKVTDFILWRAGNLRWPQFNIADAALVVGVVILFLDIGKKKEGRKAPASGRG